MVGSLGFDTAALCTLVHHLVFLETHSLNISGSGVSYGYRPGIRRHRLQMRGTCEGDEGLFSCFSIAMDLLCSICGSDCLTGKECEEGEDKTIEQVESNAKLSIMKEKENDEEGVQYQRPSHRHADVTTHVLHQPYSKTPDNGSKALFGIEAKVLSQKTSLNVVRSIPFLNLEMRHADGWTDRQTSRLGCPTKVIILHVTILIREKSNRFLRFVFWPVYIVTL